MAYAGAEFTTHILRAIKGEKGIVVPTFVNLEADVEGGKVLKKELGEEVGYFSALVELGPEGVVKINPIGKITDAEKVLVKAALPDLIANVETVRFGRFLHH